MSTIADIAARFAGAPHGPGEDVPAQVRTANSRTARRFVEEALGRGNLDVFDELVHPDVWVSTLLKPEAPIRGLDDYKAVYGGTIGAALSNATMRIEELLMTTDGAVVVRFSAEADHDKTVGSIRPTGARITLNEMHLMRFRDGRIVQNHVADLNPQQWGMIMSPIIVRAVLDQPEGRQDQVAANLATVRRFTEGFLQFADPAAADETADPEIRAYTGLKPSGPIEGIDEYKATLAAFVDAFPAVDGHSLRIVDQFASADGSRVVTRFQSRQRHAKDFFGLPATNRVILFDETHVARLTGGRIVENVVSATNPEFEMLMAPILSPLILK